MNRQTRLIERVMIGALLASLTAAPAFAHGVHTDAYPRFNSNEVVTGSEYYKLHRASAHMDRKEYDKALPLLIEASEKNPTSLMTLYNLAFCYQELALSSANFIHRGVYLHNARKGYERVQTLNPDLVVTYFKLGKLALLQNDLKMAEADYRAGIAVDDDNAGLHFNLAGVLEQQNRMEEAIAAYQTAIKHNPDFVYAYNNLGLIFERQKRQDEAEKLYKTAIKKDPSYFYARLNLGSLYAEQGEFKAAEQIYHEALKQDPDNAWAHLYLGNVYYRTGQYDKAVECYQNSIQHNPAYANAYYLLAVSLQKLNRYDEALNASLKYISLEPQGNYAGEMKNMILSLKLQNSSRVQHSK